MSYTNVYEPTENKSPQKVFKNFGLIGADDNNILQDTFGPSQELDVADARICGEIISVSLTSRGGAIIKEAADLFVFRGDPSISAADNDYLAIHAYLLEGRIHIAAADWAEALAGTDTAGSSFTESRLPFETDDTGDLYLALAHRGTTEINPGAGDNEIIEATIHIRFDP